MKTFNKIEEISQYLNDLKSGKVPFNINEYIEIIKNEFSKKLDKNFLINNEEKTLLETWYNNLKYFVHVYYNKKDYSSAILIIDNLELYITLLFDKSIINYREYLEFFHLYVYLLDLINENKNGIERCWKIHSDFMINEKKYQTSNKYSNEYTYCLVSLLRIVKTGYIMCEKARLTEMLGYFLFAEKYIEEKILFSGNDPPDIHKSVMPQQYIIGNRMMYVFMDTIQDLKGIKKLIFYIKVYLKGISFGIFRVTTGYGEKPFKLLITGIILILVYSAIYYFENLILNNSVINSIYFSLLTFTTFGLVDIQPKDLLLTKILMISEISLGLIILNMFIIFMSRKLLR